MSDELFYACDIIWSQIERLMDGWWTLSGLRTLLIFPDLMSRSSNGRLPVLREVRGTVELFRSLSGCHGVA